jgi:hypothetical protein
MLKAAAMAQRVGKRTLFFDGTKAPFNWPARPANDSTTARPYAGQQSQKKITSGT